MSSAVDEIVGLVVALTPAKAETVAEFARFVVEKQDVAEWDRKFADPKYREKFDVLADEAVREFDAGMTEPLDHGSFGAVFT